MPGERGNWDTGFQEAIPERERGQGAALQDQLGVSLHGLDWRQTGREQRGQERTLLWAIWTGSDTRHAGHLRTRRDKTLGHRLGCVGRGCAQGGLGRISRSLHTLLLPRPTLWPPSCDPMSGLGSWGPITGPPGAVGRGPRPQPGPWRWGEALCHSHLAGIRCSVRAALPRTGGPPRLEHPSCADSHPPPGPGSPRGSHPAAWSSHPLAGSAGSGEC